MRSLTLACLLCAAAPLSAQRAPCFSLNDANNTVTSAITVPDPSGPNVVAFRVTLPPAGGNAYQSIRIFTGNPRFPPGFMTLGLWGDDPTTNLPFRRISGGTWRISATLGDAWQGTNLDWDIAPAMPTPYWIVWIEPGLSTAPYQPGGVTVPTARLFQGAWRLQASEAPKFRLFCGRLDSASVSVFGRPCPTSASYWGTLFTNQAPAVGNANFALEGTGFLPGQVALLLFGPNRFGFAVQGLPPNCQHWSDTAYVLSGTTGTGDVRASASTVGASGHVTFALPIPANPTLVGLFLSSQVAVFDPPHAAPMPFSMSNALHVVVF